MTATSSTRGESGSATVQMAIVMPLLMLMLTAIIQFAVYFHAEHIGQAAAAQAVSTAGTETGNADDGRAEAQRILEKLAAGFLLHPNIKATRNAGDATVRVSGTVMSVMPFVHMRVAAVAHGPVETASVKP